MLYFFFPRCVEILGVGCLNEPSMEQLVKIMIRYFILQIWFFSWNCHKLIFSLFILFSAPWPSILKNKPNASRKEMMKIMTRYSLHLFYFDLFFSWNCNNQLTELFVCILRALKNNLRKRTRKMSIHYPNWVTWSMLCFPRIKRPFCLFSTK